MTISCRPQNEDQLRCIASALKEAGLFHQYEEQAHGEHILLSVHTRTLEERETVRMILRNAGVSEMTYGEDAAA